MRVFTGLHAGFLRSAQQFPERSALEVAGQVLSYGQLRRQAYRLAAALDRCDIVGEPPLTGVFAYRSVTAYAGVLAALCRGHGYVPFNPNFPPERTARMLERSGCRALVVDGSAAPQLPAVLDDVSRPLVLLLPHEEDSAVWQHRFPDHLVLGENRLVDENGWEPRAAAADDVAYLLFTSGSTGTPKGVMVAHRNATHYLRTMSERYGITADDRCSQLFDMTFDLSVHDMFLTWENGACLCCPGQKTLLKPGRFVRDSQLTVWFSVPSTAVFMKRLGELRPGLYPGLRWSLFCGEALPTELAATWADAAPHSIVENIYGPTELTIACTAYRWDRERSPGECELGLVPIGEPLAGMTALIVDEELKAVPPGTPGELLMSGPQVTLGYLADSERTASAFVTPPGHDQTCYRTGDRVRRAASGGPMVYLGRMDNQVKILGHRVELGEIEAALREEADVDLAAAVAWPVSPSGASGIEAFVQADRCDTAAVLERLRARLPSYMIPRRIQALPQFPFNSSGKADRTALLNLLQDQS